MTVNGLVHLIRTKDASYRLAYTPVGVPVDSSPERRFGDERDLAAFLAGALRIDGREIGTALGALARNGRYCVSDVRLSPEALRGLGLDAGC